MLKRHPLMSSRSSSSKKSSSRSSSLKGLTGQLGDLSIPSIAPRDDEVEDLHIDSDAMDSDSDDDADKGVTTVVDGIQKIKAKWVKDVYGQLEKLGVSSSVLNEKHKTVEKATKFCAERELKKYKDKPLLDPNEYFAAIMECKKEQDRLRKDKLRAQASGAEPTPNYLKRLKETMGDWKKEVADRAVSEIEKAASAARKRIESQKTLEKDEKDGGVAEFLKRLELAKSKIKAHQEEIQAREASMKSHKRELDERLASNQIPGLGDIAESKKRLEDLNKERKDLTQKIKKHEAKIAEALPLLESVTSRLKTSTEKHGKLAKELKELEKTHKELDKKVQTLNKPGKSGDRQKLIKQLEKQLVLLEKLKKKLQEGKVVKRTYLQGLKGLNDDEKKILTTTTWEDKAIVDLLRQHNKITDQMTQEHEEEMKKIRTTLEAVPSQRKKKVTTPKNPAKDLYLLFGGGKVSDKSSSKSSKTVDDDDDDEMDLDT